MQNKAMDSSAGWMIGDVLMIESGSLGTTEVNGNREENTSDTWSKLKKN